MTSQETLKLIIEAAEASACEATVLTESGYELATWVDPDLFVSELKKHLT